MSDSPIVEVNHLFVTFGKFHAVKDVSFSVGAGEVFGFLGANGAGKTTTIRVLCGLLQASSGEVVIDGIKFTAGKEDLIKAKVGYMSQKFTLYDDLSIEENLRFSASLRKLDENIYQQRRRNLLDFIGFDSDMNQMAAELPGGIKQEIALMASLLHDPKIIFLDEPTAGVSSVARSRFWRLINQLSKSGKTVFVKGVGDYFGISDSKVKSPSFTLVNEYKTKSGIYLIHSDLYRLEDYNQVNSLGLEDYVNSDDCILFVEWPERWKNIPDFNTVKIYFTALNENEREIKIQS